MSEDRTTTPRRTATKLEVGLCAECRHAHQQPNRRGSVFWRCGRAETDPQFLRYPPLPVLICPGYERQAARCAVDD